MDHIEPFGVINQINNGTDSAPTESAHLGCPRDCCPQLISEKTVNFLCEWNYLDQISEGFSTTILTYYVSRALLCSYQIYITQNMSSQTD